MGRVFSRQSVKSSQKMKPFARVSLSASVLVSAAYIGSRFSNVLAVCVVIAAVTVILAFAKSKSGFFFIAIPSFLVWSYTGNIHLAVMLCAITVSIGAGAFLLKMTSSPLLLFLLPLSFLLSFLCGGSPIAALLSLSVFPPIAALASVFDGKLDRVRVICRLSSVIFITAAAVGISYIAVTYRSLHPKTLFSVLDGIFEKMTSYYLRQRAAYGSSLTVNETKLYSLSVYETLPAFSIIVINVISFISQHITISLLVAANQTKYLNIRSLSFTMSWVSATVFTAAYLTMLGAMYSHDEEIYIIAKNIYLILLPGLVFTGILVLLGKKEGGKRHIFWLILLIILFFISPNTAILSAAFIGCSVIITMALRRLFLSGREN